MSKGGTTSGSTEIPAWLESAAIENINKARDVSQIGYVPYYGPDVAAFSPMQQQSMQSTGNAASAFGLAPQGFDAMAGMPQAQTFAGGIQGYSSAPLYEQSLDKLFANAPAQYRAMNDMFIDPFTGARPRGGYGATPTQVSQMSSGGNGNSPYGNDANMAHLARTYNPNSQPDYQPAVDGGTGYWSGGEKTGMQTNLMTGDEYEAYVLAHGLPPEGDTFMDGVRGFGRSFVNNGLLGSLYESVTGNPIMQRDIDPSDPNYYETMYGDQSQFYPLGGSAMAAQQEADRRAARQAEDLAAPARREAARVEAAKVQAAMQAEVDYNQQMQREAALLENLNLSAVTTPYIAPVVRSTVNSGPSDNAGRNSSGNGFGASSRSGSTSSGQTDYGFF